MKKAPIAFFAYKRPEHTRRSLESLAQNEGANESELFVFCDGAKSLEEQVTVDQVREIVRIKQWCGQVHIIERKENWGLAHSIISGVTQLCASYGRVIVMEDDLIVSPYFLSYMNDALEKYEYETTVMHISGYMFPIEADLPETFFCKIMSCWGWATWQRAWKYFETDVARLLAVIKSKKLEKEFSVNGTYPYIKILEKQNRGKIDSWAICWYASIFISKGLCLYPKYSLVKNTGHDSSGVHCKSNNVFNVRIYRNKINSFSTSIAEDKQAYDTLIKYFESATSKKKYLKNVFAVLKKIVNTK